MDERSKTLIQKTASVIFDLAEHTSFSYTNEIAELIHKKVGLQNDRILTTHFAALPVSRFSTTHSLLEMMAEKFDGQLQIIELGAGFTPHYLNLKAPIKKYIEVDLEENSILKREIFKELSGSIRNISFISGNILESNTWENIANEIETTFPVFIFSEGVVAQYFSDKEKESLSQFIKKLLVIEGSSFVIDDTMRNHPELHKHKIISEGIKKIADISGSSIYASVFQDFETEFKNWKRYFSELNTLNLNYVLSKPEMDFALKEFKLTMSIKDSNNHFIPSLLKYSESNKEKRNWF